MSDRDGDDWKARVIPGYQAPPLSIRVLLTLTAFAAQTALGLLISENLLFLLNRPTYTAIGAAVIVIPLLLWNAWALGRGIERKRLEEQEKTTEKEQNQEESLTGKQRLEVDDMIHRRLQRDQRQRNRSDKAVIELLSEIINSGTDVDSLDIADPEVRERIAEQRTELEQVRQSQITEEDVREIVAESLDSAADSQEVHQIADDIESRINELESYAEDTRNTLNLFYDTAKREIDDFEPTSAEETEQGRKNQEGGPQRWSQEKDERDPEFEK